MYEKRTYRDLYKSRDLIFFNLCLGETDLSIGVDPDIKNEAYLAAKKSVYSSREIIEGYIKRDPSFGRSFIPLPIYEKDPYIIRRMKEASDSAGVGPMASVAGAVAEIAGNVLMEISRQVIVENGGDIFIFTSETRKIGIYAGKSSLNEKIALLIKPSLNPLGICTSSGTVGHSISFGRADACVVLSEDVFLADAVATAAANLVKDESKIQEALDFAKSICGITGVLVICKDQMGACGNIELTGF